MRWRHGRSEKLWLVALVVAGCQRASSSSPQTATGGGDSSFDAMPGEAGQGSTATVADAGNSPYSCSDLFDQNVVPAYGVDISSDAWAKLNADFHDIKDVAAGTPPKTYYPIVFHYGAETVANAAIRLRGKSSWINTVLYDANPKMQFDISFDQVDTNQRFHGLASIHLAMPRDDWTFLNTRIGNNWFRKIGLAAPCANSATVTVNGSLYGVYVAEGPENAKLLKQFFPNNSGGDLFEYGTEPKTNISSPDWTRLQTLQGAGDISSLGAIVDLPNTLLEWAAEAVVNDADGYYGGSHNYYLYDEGGPGYDWLVNQTDSALEWLEMFSTLSYKQHPIYWWQGRPLPDPPGTDWLIALINDPVWLGHYTDAIATQVGKWNVQEILGWIDAWSAQISGAVMSDPHKWATPSQISSALAALRDVAQNRPQYLQSFVNCEHGVAADSTDADNDGYPWCNDCDDGNPGIHPGAPEICGNHIDDNCNGVVDENCPGEQPGYPGEVDAGVAATGSH
jgi:hypothetical protein